VSRGGEKLAGALERFALDLRGAHVLDVGASTGGFTDCALQAGATMSCVSTSAAQLTRSCAPITGHQPGKKKKKKKKKKK